MDIKGINKAKILAGLYNNSRPLGLGMLHYNPENMTEEQAQKLLDDGNTYFDYLEGGQQKESLSLSHHE